MAEKAKTCVWGHYMTYYTITSIQDGRSLYCGDFTTFRACIETAVSAGISLHHADLRQTNLLNATLDGADLRGADFTGANLTGANLSEAKLDNALFFGTALMNAVLCESSLKGTHFIDSSFGATLLDSALLDQAHFSGLSTFSLDFTVVQKMRNCVFLNPCGTICPITRPPVVIQGLSHPFIVMDRHMKIGHAVYCLESKTSADLWPAGHGILNPGQLRLRLERIIAGTRAKAA